MAARLGVALTVKQPWAHLIVQGVKDIENRSWRPAHVQRVLIHAGGLQGYDPVDWVLADELAEQAGYELPVAQALTFGAIIGEASILGVDEQAEDNGSLWAQPGHVHWRLADPVVWERPFRCRGLPGFFDVYADGTTLSRGVALSR